MASFAAVAQAGGFPDRSITIVVPFPAGGPTDRHVRVLADVLGAQLGQSVVVENRPGAGGTLGTGTMALTAKPDGYTLGLYSNAMLRVPHMQKTPWHPINDFSFVAGVSTSNGNNFGFLVRGDSPFRTFTEFRAAALQEPGKLSFGSPGIGATTHLLIEELADASGMQLVHAPYKGSGEMIQAVMGGHVTAMSDLSGGWESLVDKGSLRLLLLFGERPSRRWPEVPTARSLGYDIVGASSYGLVGPRGIDASVLKVLGDAVAAALKDPRLLASHEQLGLEPWPRGGESYRQWASARFEKERSLIRRLGLLAN